MNFLGLDVRGLDLHVFFVLARGLFAVLYIAGLAWLWRRRRASVLFPLALALAFWLIVTFPLQRIYGLQDPSDRLRNLWWCSTAAAGNPPWESGVVGRPSADARHFALASQALG